MLSSVTVKYLVIGILAIALAPGTGSTVPMSSDGETAPPSLAPVSTYPHFESFESGRGDWTSGGTASTWAFGTPNKSVIRGAASGSSAWVNGGLSGSYADDELSNVQTAQGFNFTGLAAPMVRFRGWRSLEAGWDYVTFQASTNGGSTWVTVGAYGDPNNWYNESPGWSGNSGGYVTMIHSLQSYAGAPSVKFRFLFDSDSSITQDGFAFDDFSIFDNVPRVNVGDASPLGSIDSVPPGAIDMLMQTLRLDATGSSNVNINSIAITRTGSLQDADITAVKLWLDNGDTVFRAADDAIIATATFSGGYINFTGLGAALNLILFQPRWLHITYSLSATAPPGGTFGCSIQNTSDIVPSIALPIALPTVPFASATRTVFSRVNSLPFTDTFDAPGIANRTTEVRAGVYYPTAAGPGPFVHLSPSPAPNRGFTQITGQVADGAGGFITPSSAPFMTALSSPFGGAASSLEYSFDLSALNVNDHLLWLMFSWNNANMNDHDLNNVFISTDAGASWAASVYRFDFSAPVPPGWHDEVVDVSTPLLFSGTDYSATTVLRFQAFGLYDFGQDGLTIDNIWLGIPQYAHIERIPGTGLPSGTVDGIYGMGTGPITLTYTLTNSAHLPLDVGAITTSGETGLSNLAITPATLPTPMNPGQSVSFDVSFDASDENFSFLLEFPTNDPRVMGGVYALTVIGEHAPAMEVQRPAGVPIANGSVDDIGQNVAGQNGSLTYTIVNDGTLPLVFTDAPDAVTITNADNITALVTRQPDLAEVPPSGSVTFDIAYSVIDEADFQFDLLIANNVAAVDPYTVTVSGTAALGMPDAGPGGDAGPTGDAGPGGADAGTTPPDDDTCSCTVGRKPARGPSPVLFLVLAVFAGFQITRRRRLQSISSLWKTR